MRDLPSTLYRDGVIHVPEHLAIAYEKVLRDHGYYDEALKQPPSGDKIIGGEDHESTLMHFAHRFLVSASRVQCVVLDPRQKLNDISLDLRISLSSGNVSLLDAPSGSGASLLALLSVLAELRNSGYAPLLPINITACCGDISKTAHEIQSSLLKIIHPWLLSQGISLKLKQSIWDASREDNSAALVDTWFKYSQPTSEHLVLVAAFSGAGASNFEYYENSFRHFAARLHDKFATMLWIEPG